MKPYDIARYRDRARERLGVLPADMLLAFLNRQARPLVDARERLRHAVRTLAQWQAQRRRLRAALERAIGGPRRTGPARVEVCREVRRGPGVIRTLIIRPFPGHAITANLFLPARANGPLPVIINPQGHSYYGKNMGGSAPFFVCNGYACLTFDFFGAGERSYPGFDGAVYAPSTAQHNILGNQMGLYGYNLNWFMAYDTMACIDYAAGLPEIDASRIGITGASGGGTESFLVTALDERIAVAAPAASVHSFRNTLYPGDAEQVFWDHVAQGMDYPDLGSFLVAPRPLLVIANTHDIWDIQSTRYAVAEMKRFYALHAGANRLSLRVWDRGHECSGEQMTVILRWFNRWLRPRSAQPEVTDTAAARAFRPREADLLATRTGGLVSDGHPSAREVFQRHLARSPAPPAAAPPVVRRWLSGALGRLPRAVPWEVLDNSSIAGFELQRIMFAPEPGLWLPAEVVYPWSPGTPRRVGKSRGLAVLLDEVGRLADPDWQVEVASAGYVALRPDLRGWGETALPEKWEEWENWLQTLLNGNRMNQAAYARCVGRSLPVDRARDVLALLNVAGKMGITGSTRLWGRRGGALVALLAGVRDRRIVSLTLERFLFSFADVVRHDIPTLWLDNLIDGTLARGIDIPQFCRAFAPRKITIRQPLDGRMRPVSPGATGSLLPVP